MKRAIYFTGFALLALALFACGGKDAAPPTASDAPGSGASGGNRSGGGPATGGSGSGATISYAGNFLDFQRFPLDLIISGGVNKDGIPALTDPDFVPANSADAAYLSDDDLVLGIRIHGQARAYPHNFGWHHEIINDVIGGQPVIVTLCPLTGTGMVFDGEGIPERREMGVSGLLFNNNLIMYDRSDGVSLFPQMTHIAVRGFQVGQELHLLPVVETTWGYWKKLYPNTSVISGRTPGAYNIGRYNTYPYGDYRVSHTQPMFPVFPNFEDNPIVSNHMFKDLVLGVRFRDRAKAYPFPAMGEEAVINDTVADNNIVVVYFAEMQMAVPYDRDHGGRTLTFEKAPSTDTVYPFMMKDRETGSTWNLKGEAVSGGLKGSRLRQIPAHNAFWFAWATFWQNTEVYTP